MKRPLRTLSEQTLRDLMQYEWPGNIRELENAMEQAVIIGEEEGIKLRKRPAPLTNHRAPLQTETTLPLPAMTDEIVKVLVQTKGKILGEGGAARILNLRPAEVEVCERQWILEHLKKRKAAFVAIKELHALSG